MRVSLLSSLMVLPICAVATDCRPTPGKTIGTHFDISKATHQPGDLGTGLATQWIAGSRVEEARCYLVLQPIPE